MNIGMTVGLSAMIAAAFVGVAHVFLDPDFAPGDGPWYSLVRNLKDAAFAFLFSVFVSGLIVFLASLAVHLWM